MSSAAEKANLARIRDNQRRSRARRKEYLQELENRVRQCELQGIEASSEIQVAARRVADENRKLRLLLNQHGIFDDMIDHHLVSTVLSEGGGGQAVTLLDELLQPRKPVGLGTPSITGLSLGSMGEYGREVSRDSSVGSISTTQSSVWDQPMASVHPCSGHKRHRSAQTQLRPNDSSTPRTQSGQGSTGVNRSESRESPIHQRRSNMLTPNQGPQQNNIPIQLSTNLSPTDTSINPSPIYDPNKFDFDPQSNDPFDSNGLFYQTPSTHSLFDQYPQTPSPNSLHTQLQPQPNCPSNSQAAIHNRGSDHNKSNFEATLMNTSSCIFATDMIGTMTGEKEEDVRAKLGCNKGEDCDISDEIVFGVIERYS